MKKINVLGVTLTISSKCELPTFETASAKFSERFPGIFSIKDFKEAGHGWYMVQVSPTSILDALASLQAISQEKAAVKFLKQDAKNH